MVHLKKTERAKMLRRKGGAWLRSLREAADLTQKQLADRLGFEYYTFISGVESGRGRPPHDQLHAWASALGVDVKTFTMTFLRYYEPEVYEALTGARAAALDGGEQLQKGMIC